MSRFLRRKPPQRRSASFASSSQEERPPCCLCEKCEDSPDCCQHQCLTSDDSEDDRADENLSILREALHHFALGINTPSGSDEDEEGEEHLTDEEQVHLPEQEHLTGEDHSDESLEDEEQEHLPDEDRSADEGHSDESLEDDECAGLTVLRETLFALAQHYTSDESGESQDEGDKDEPAPP